MSARDTFNSTVKSAAITQANTAFAAEATRQQSVNGATLDQGINPALGVTASQAATINAASAAKLASVFNAMAAQQAATANARDILRQNNDFGPT